MICGATVLTNAATIARGRLSVAASLRKLGLLVAAPRIGVVMECVDVHVQFWIDFEDLLDRRVGQFNPVQIKRFKRLDLREFQKWSFVDVYSDQV